MSQQKPQQAAKDLWKSTADALLASDDVDAIYDRLSGLEVSLDADPLAYGPKRLQEKTAMCRKHLTDCERIFLDVSHRLHRIKRSLRAKKSALDLSTKYLYAEDPEVRAGRNIADRDAFAAIKLKDEWMEVHTLEQQVQDMEAVITVIKTKRSDLRDTQGRLRDQIRLCGQELELGGRWGTKRPNAPEIVPGRQANGADVEQVLELIDDVDVAQAEVHLPAGNAGFVNPDDKIDLDALEDESGDLGDGGSEDLDTEDSVSLSETEGDPKDVLPGNGVSSAEIDTLLKSMSLPASTSSKNTPSIEDKDIDSLLEMF